MQVLLTTFYPLSTKNSDYRIFVAIVHCLNLKLPLFVCVCTYVHTHADTCMYKCVFMSVYISIYGSFYGFLCFPFNVYDCFAVSINDFLYFGNFYIIILFKGAQYFTFIDKGVVNMLSLKVSTAESRKDKHGYRYQPILASQGTRKIQRAGRTWDLSRLFCSPSLSFFQQNRPVSLHLQGQPCPYFR